MLFKFSHNIMYLQIFEESVIYIQAIWPCNILCCFLMAKMGTVREGFEFNLYQKEAKAVNEGVLCF